MDYVVDLLIPAVLIFGPAVFAAIKKAVKENSASRPERQHRQPGATRDESYLERTKGFRMPEPPEHEELPSPNAKPDKRRWLDTDEGQRVAPNLAEPTPTSDNEAIDTTTADESLRLHREKWRQAIIGAEILNPKFIK